jgi:hypothetical protein
MHAGTRDGIQSDPAGGMGRDEQGMPLDQGMHERPGKARGEVAGRA